MMDKIDLQQFCADSGDVRYNIIHPWSDGEYTYATNGHIIVRVGRLPDVEENTKAPDAATLFNKTAPPGAWLPVPVAAMPPSFECKECHGTGIFEYAFEGKEEVEDCEWCGKTGRVRQLLGLRVGGVSFDQGYLSMIQGWEIAPNGPKLAAWIRNGDVVGLLMPRNE